ncbi:MAG: two-component regulator propeller domain-containing protein [Bacteroidota bacterium]
MKYLYAFSLLLSLYTSCGKSQMEGKKITINPETKGVFTPHGPQSITRNIIQDKKGNIWIATFAGIFKYNGTSFIHITGKISTASFFSVLEDSKGNMWFGSIGSGVYYYDGKSFQNFTTGDGLLNNDVGSIYEDKKGNIWFGVFGGASRYDGKSFQNYIINGDAMEEDKTGKTFENRPPHEVTAIIEDKTGRFWFATRGNTFTYDGKKCTVFSHEGKPFKNVRCIIEDKKGNIWLAGADGLWRYNGTTFTNFTQNFVGYVYEDRNRNIWTSAEKDDKKEWALSRYDKKSLSDSKPKPTEITTQPMYFGILEANDGSIWFGSLDGVHRYNGNAITNFKDIEGPE